MTTHLKACPKCGKPCKGAGLNGHLRFTHRLNEDEINALVAEAKSAGPATPKTTQPENPVYRLMDELMEIQRRRAVLQTQTSLLPMGNNPVVDKALSLLDAMEKEISKKLDEAKRQKGLPVGFFEEVDEALGLRRKGGAP